MELSKQTALLAKFDNWFNSAGYGGVSSINDVVLSPRNILEENRRRYRMLLSQKDLERKRRDLSALPSTKSRSIVDSIADNFIAEYFQDPDSISFTAKSTTDPEADQLAAWLTQIFYYRSQYTFPFYAWHEQSIKAGLVDGLECAYVYWKKDSYTKKAPKQYLYVDPQTGIPGEIDKKAYDAAIKAGFGDNVAAIEPEEEVTVTDSWWIDKLIPGEQVRWDMTAPYMDVNQGQWCCLTLRWPIETIQNHIKSGLFDAISTKELTEWQTAKKDSRNADRLRFTIDADKLQRDDLSLISVNIFFFKKGCQWQVQFSLEGDTELSGFKDVNEVFFAGRPVNRLPVIIGYNRSNIHEEFGCGIPFLISSHEDEYSQTRNNIQDAANMKLQRKWRISKGSDVNIDDLVNRPAFYADQGEVEAVNDHADMMPAMRTNDSQSADINSLVPVDMMNMGRSVAPKGMNQTLGTVQLSQQDSSLKRNNMLMLRNQTFMQPLLYLIAELEMAFETDETVARVAAKRAGITAPETMGQLDLTKLDFPINVSINAGMGSIPRYQKAQNLMQIAGWRMQNNVPTDTISIAGQLNVLAGFDKDSFLPSEEPPPPPPKVEYKATVNMDVALLPPEAQQFLLQTMMNGGMDVTAKVDDEKTQKMLNQMQQNGGMGAPPDIRPITDATGPEAQGMSAGGQHGGY